MQMRTKHPSEPSLRTHRSDFRPTSTCSPLPVLRSFLASKPKAARNHPRASRHSSISEHGRIVTHVASLEYTKRHVACCRLPFRVGVSFLLGCPRDFGAKNRNSPSPPDGRFAVAAPYSRFSPASSNRCPRRISAPPFVVELFAARLSQKVTELSMPGWCTSGARLHAGMRCMSAFASLPAPQVDLVARSLGHARSVQSSPRRANDAPGHSTAGHAPASNPLATSPTSLFTAFWNRTKRSVLVVPPPSQDNPWDRDSGLPHSKLYVLSVDLGREHSAPEKPKSVTKCLSSRRGSTGSTFTWKDC